jgi:hypothetical protein
MDLSADRLGLGFELFVHGNSCSSDTLAKLVKPTLSI